ncbi:MAG: hypothetical protein AABZ08_02310 [Planctomycetota bacterium]
MTSVNKETTPFRRRLMLIIIAGILARAAVIVYSNQNPKLFDFPDSHRYFTVARNIADGLGPIDSPTVRAGTDPLYPILLSIGIASGLTCDDQLMRWAQLINTLASVASIIAVAGIARNLFSERVALIGAAVFALDPITLFFNTLALTETVYSALLLMACDLVTRRHGFYYTPIVLRFCGAGIFLGFAGITRSSGLFLPIFLAAATLLRGIPKVVRPTAIATLFTFIVVPSIMILVQGEINKHIFVPIRTGSGASLMEALGPWADGGPGMDRIVYPPFPPNANEYERDQLCRTAALDWAKQNPARTISLAWTKLLRTWSITINASDYSSPLYKAVGWLTVAPVFALALIGVVLLRSQRATLALLLAPVAYFTILHMIFVGSVRYRMPAMPFVFILAAVAMTRIIDRKAAKA